MSFETAILLTILTFLLLAFGMVLFVVRYQGKLARYDANMRLLEAQQEEQLRHTALEAEEEERRRIAAELHDDVGATLASANFILSGMEDSEGTNSKLLTAQEILSDALHKVRSLSHQLQPGVLDYLGLQKALASLAQSFSSTTGTTISCQCNGTLPEMPSSRQLAVYRIVQELLHNTIKHAHPKSIQLTCDALSAPFQLLIRHDGEGMTSDEFEENIRKAGGIGLKNLAHRMAVSKIAIHWLQVPNGMYEILIQVPDTA